jgi:hypothetical protein
LRRRFEPDDPASDGAGFSREQERFQRRERFMREMVGNRSRSTSRAAVVNRSFIVLGKWRGEPSPRYATAFKVTREPNGRR